MEPAVKDHLDAALTSARKDIETKLVELKGLLERVKGISYWITRDIAIVKWCEDLIEETLQPRPLLKVASDKEVSL